MSTERQDAALDVAVSRDGVHVVGVRTGSYHGGYGGVSYPWRGGRHKAAQGSVKGFVNRYTGAGNPRWSVPLDLCTAPEVAATPEVLACEGTVKHVSADGAGNSLLLTSSKMTVAYQGISYAGSLVKLDPSGALLWRTSLPRSANPTALLSAPDGHVYVVWQSGYDPRTFQWEELRLGAFGPDGVPLWDRGLDMRPTSGDDLRHTRVADLSLAPDGSLFVAGLDRLTKFTGGGELLWTRRLDDPGAVSGVLAAEQAVPYSAEVALSERGRVYVARETGTLRPPAGLDPLNLRVETFDASGGVGWSTSVARAEDQVGETFMAVSGEGRLYLVGPRSQGGLEEGFRVRVYSPEGRLERAGAFQAEGRPNGVALAAGAQGEDVLYVVGEEACAERGCLNAFLARYEGLSVSWRRD